VDDPVDKSRITPLTLILVGLVKICADPLGGRGGFSSHRDFSHMEKIPLSSHFSNEIGKAHHVRGNEEQQTYFKAIGGKEARD
jgi:hypothetical protein